MFEKFKILIEKHKDFFIFAIFIVAFFLMITNANALTVGKYAGKGTNVPDGNTVAWANPNNITTSNDSYATITGTSTPSSQRLDANSFGFAIPANSTIQGISVIVERSKTAAVCTLMAEQTVRLRHSNNTMGIDNNTIATGFSSVSDQNIDHNGSVDRTWSETWTADEINSANFGVSFQTQTVGATCVAQVDTIYILITYILNASPDVNVWKIDGFRDNQNMPIFSYNNDGNLTIDFNIQDADNNSLLIDLNLSPQNTEGTGTVLLNDWNSMNAPIYCDSNNFATRTTCHYDLNISPSLVSDGNWYFLVSADDGISNPAFESSDRNFMIDNTPPTTNLFGCGTGTNYVPQIISLPCTDSNAGCFTTYYKINSTDQNQTAYPYLWISSLSTEIISRFNLATGKVDKNVSIGSISYGTAIDKNNNVWVSNYDLNTVSRINPITNSIDINIPVIANPRGIAVDSNGNIWVANSGALSTIVSRINPITQTVDTNITVGASPYYVAIDRNQNVWVTSTTNKRVDRIDPITQTVVKSINTGASTQGITIDSNQNVWVTNTDLNTVSRINPVTQTIDINIGVGGNPRGIVADSNGGIWVANYGSNNVSHINPLTQVNDFNIEIGTISYELAVDSNNNIWVINYASVLDKIVRINPISRKLDLNYTGFSNPYGGGDLSGYAFQNFTETNGWKQLGGGVLPDNFTISADGNHRIDFYSIDRGGNIESVKTGYCKIQASGWKDFRLNYDGVISLISTLRDQIEVYSNMFLRDSNLNVSNNIAIGTETGDGNKLQVEGKVHVSNDSVFDGNLYIAKNLTVNDINVLTSAKIPTLFNHVTVTYSPAIHVSKGSNEKESELFDLAETSSTCLKADNGVWGKQYWHFKEPDLFERIQKIMADLNWADYPQQRYELKFIENDPECIGLINSEKEGYFLKELIQECPLENKTVDFENKKCNEPTIQPIEETI